MLDNHHGGHCIVAPTARALSTSSRLLCESSMPCRIASTSQPASAPPPPGHPCKGRRVLVWVLTISKGLHEGEVERKGVRGQGSGSGLGDFGGVLRLTPLKILRDQRIIRRDVARGARRLRWSGSPRLARPLGKDRAVVRRIGQDQHRSEVLCSGVSWWGRLRLSAQGFLKRGSFFCYGLGEGIQVDRHDVDCLEVVLMKLAIWPGSSRFANASGLPGAMS